MHDRRPLAALLVAALAVALPGPGAAQGAPAGNLRLNFIAPKGWTDTTRPSDRAGIWKDWMLRDGGAVHSIVLSVTRESRPAAAYGDASVALMKSIPGVTMMESGPATACGDVPAFAYTYRSERTPGHPMIIRHLLVDVGPLLGDVSYAHPPDAADRADARDAMSTLCDEQIYAPRPPAGWRAGGLSVTGRAGVGAYTAPSGKDAFIALAVSAPVSMQTTLLAPETLGPGAALVTDAEENCGATRVRRTSFRSTAAGAASLTEKLSGYRHGVAYIYTYSRPESTPPDPEAERALTSFCDAGATLATPAPAAPQSKSPA